MGIFWDLIQQSQIEDQKKQAATTEQRLAYVEDELHKTKVLLVKALKVLEQHSGQDIDGDGILG